MLSLDNIWTDQISTLKSHLLANLQYRRFLLCLNIVLYSRIRKQLLLAAPKSPREQ